MYMFILMWVVIVTVIMSSSREFTSGTLAGLIAVATLSLTFQLSLIWNELSNLNKKPPVELERADKKENACTTAA